VRSGSIARTQVYTSRTAALHEKQAADPMPQDVGTGAFPSVKVGGGVPTSHEAIREAAAGPTLEMLGSEGGGLPQRKVPPPLPKR
jgi:hypothetical protein